ncbi:MAG: ECF transporter S component [Infirmifilum sp.]|jgi:energy-coupling factor transport system substrate-specific component|uniref:ECF transporter S component n=1 Tax=Infirmifilum TaxID=2856573 RepID=UPI00069BB85E|nr:ECF transporter S component [Infirmifilum uzonense]
MKTRLTVVELVFTAAISTVIGAIFLVWSNIVWDATKLILGLLFLPIIYGMWFIGATIPAYIIRKPGVALLGEVLASIMEMAYGSQFSSTVLLYGFMQGLLSELTFMATRYKRWGWVTMTLAGAMPALWAAPADTILYGIAEPLTPEQRVVFWSLYFVSGGIFAGILVKAVIDAVARSTPILDPFEVAKSVKSLGDSLSRFPQRLIRV